MKKIFLLSLFLVATAIILSGCSWPGRGLAPVACTMEAKICPDGSSVGRQGPNCEFAECPMAELANPASVYCQANGGVSQVILDESGNQFGICKLTDGTLCDEWKYFRGECGSATQPNENKINSIKQAFATKYNKNISEITINIAQETENYMRGGVKFGVGGVGEGGIFFATQIEGVWKIISDGNGMVDCSVLKAYDFPANMAPDCSNL